MPIWLQDILKNECFIWCVMAVIIFGITQLLKLPIKHFTNKIKNARVKKIVNAVILLIPFAFGIIAEVLLCEYYPYGAYEGKSLSDFSIITGLGYGTAGISLYGIIERFFKVKVENPYNTEEGKAVTEFVGDITADGKVDSTDKSAVQEFLDKVGK